MGYRLWASGAVRLNKSRRSYPASLMISVFWLLTAPASRGETTDDIRDEPARHIGGPEHRARSGRRGVGTDDDRRHRQGGDHQRRIARHGERPDVARHQGGHPRAGAGAQRRWHPAGLRHLRPELSGCRHPHPAAAGTHRAGHRPVAADPAGHAQPQRADPDQSGQLRVRARARRADVRVDPGGDRGRARASAGGVRLRPRLLRHRGSTTRSSY